MQFRTRTRKRPTVDITPMVDAVFLLLIFFMVTTTFSSVSGIKLNLPEAKTKEIQEEPKQVLVTVDREGRLFVKGEAVEPADLGKRMLNAVEGNPERVIVIQADRETQHGTVVTILDTARQLGLSRLAIAAKPEEGAGAAE